MTISTHRQHDPVTGNKVETEPMSSAEFKNGPLLDGWVIAVAAGLVAGGVASVIGDFNLMQASFTGIVLTTVLGLVIGLRWGEPGMAPPAPVVPAAEPATAPVPAASTPARAAPAAMAPAAVTAAAATGAPARKPEGLSMAREGKADDLKEIKGIGPKLEVLCHSLGFYHFDQIAHWTPEEIAWVDDNLEGFNGRVTRDDWVEQAKILAAGGKTEHSAGVRAGRIH
ncbi:NADH:ubiquinone oxidoreductase [Paracoccaceae bacterium Fryx2]|nr:NADH:ubiquinone oxidoreductase [Paracoccaceae bacterium Fryx2]